MNIRCTYRIITISSNFQYLPTSQSNYCLIIWYITSHNTSYYCSCHISHTLIHQSLLPYIHIIIHSRSSSIPDIYHITFICFHVDASPCLPPHSGLPARKCSHSFLTWCHPTSVLNPRVSRLCWMHLVSPTPLCSISELTLSPSFFPWRGMRRSSPPYLTYTSSHKTKQVVSPFTSSSFSSFLNVGWLFPLVFPFLLTRVMWEDLFLSWVWSWIYAAPIGL